MGDSLKQVKSFPEQVRRDIGSSLYDVQLGDKPDNAKPFKGDDSQTPEDKAALFRYWFDLAKEMGHCSKSEIREDGDRWVCMSGTWEKFTAAWERGYTLEYLRKLMKKIKNP